MRISEWRSTWFHLEPDLTDANDWSPHWFPQMSDQVLAPTNQWIVWFHPTAKDKGRTKSYTDPSTSDFVVLASNGVSISMKPADTRPLCPTNNDRAKKQASPWRSFPMLQKTTKRGNLDLLCREAVDESVWILDWWTYTVVSTTHSVHTSYLYL
jgi:hypothetical protein